MAGKYRPLADELRPTELDDVVGQGHILGPDGLLRRIIESGQNAFFNLVYLIGDNGIFVIYMGLKLNWIADFSTDQCFFHIFVKIAFADGYLLSWVRIFLSSLQVNDGQMFRFERASGLCL